MPSHTPEPEFEQARGEIESTLGPLFEKRPDLKKAFEIVQIPERIVQFRVVWEDDQGQCQINTGYRVQFNSALGPYKGGLRLHPSVNLSILKFLGFEQIFKNALTGLAMGGGKGGSDFDPKGRTDNEIRKFCYAFMRELSRHIGPNTDVPAGDIGVGGREVGYMFGAYKQIRNEFSGILTGKGFDFGGSRLRPEATGYGLVYYVQHMLAKLEGKPLEETFKGKTVAISGSGNVSQYAALKVIELGGIVVSLSDSKGCLLGSLDKGISAADVVAIQALKLKHGSLSDYLKSQANGKTYAYYPGDRPWAKFEKIDVALPCATQNEVSADEAKALVDAGCLIVAEGSNMGSTQEAIDVFEAARQSGKAVAGRKQPLWYAPGKAANLGGVAVSARLEMAQNSSRIQWTAEEVDAKLKGIMENCYNTCVKTAEEYTPTKGSALPSLVAGANIAGFLKVAEAMHAQGDFW